LKDDSTKEKYDYKPPHNFCEGEPMSNSILRFKKKLIHKVLGILLATVLMVGMVFNASAALKSAADDDTGDILNPVVSKRYGYYDYMKDFSSAEEPLDEYIIPAKDYIKNSGAEVSAAENENGENTAIDWSNQAGELTYQVDIKQGGKYRIELGYLPSEDRTGNIELEVLINGEIPFDESERISLQRLWKDQTEIRRDNRDNDLRPTQVTQTVWMYEDLRDKDGIYSDAFQYYFNKGINTLTFRIVREPVRLAHIRIYNEKEAVPYAEYRKNFNNTSGPKNFSRVFQAEKTLYKSDPNLYPTSDRTSPLTQPYSPSKVRLNTIGGDATFKYPGQWVEWEIEVPEEGDYVIAFRARQDQLRGLYSHRRIYINGEVPFEELKEIRYSYNKDWRTMALGDGENPYLVHLKKGKNTVRIEAVIGSMGATINAIEDSVFDLNSMYRKIIMITGVTPDIYRDYNIKKEIPELPSEFRRIAKLFEDELSRIEQSIGRGSSEVALLREMAVQLNSLADKPESIVERLERYKSNIVSLSAWISEIKNQPLEIDYIWLGSPEMELPRSKATFWEKVVHEVKAFVYSFIESYDQIGNVADSREALKVWVNSGRDQAQIIKTMTDDLFTAKTGIPVNVSLVNGTIMEATMAGKGPDIALNIARYLPVDLAVRGALLDLNQFDGFDDQLISEFQKTAFIPYTLNGKVYAIPETQDFNMLFYRKDILEELNISPPKTWDDLFKIIPIIERNNMEIGIPSLIQQAAGDTYMPFPRTFITLLLQRGLNYYTDDMKKTTFDDIRAVEAFTQFIDMYREYSLPVYYDFANRFRTGEMPIGIASFSTYNLLYIFAPEIRNLWDMTMIPGTIKEDGTIDYSEEAYGNACVIFKGVKNKDDAFEFVKWWTGAEAQTRYCREMESLMGPAARQPTANLKAFQTLSWSAKELAVLEKQRSYIVEQPEIPGSYFVSRNLNNAIIETIYDGGNPLATLEKYNKYINEEIERKRLEFGLGGGE